MLRERSVPTAVAVILIAGMVGSGTWASLVAASRPTTSPPTAPAALASPADKPATPPATVAAETPLRDSWFVLRDGDLAWGTTRLRVGALDDGNRSYLAETRMLMEFMGTRQEMRSRSTVVVDADLAPIRLESELVQMAVTLRAEGEMTPHGFVVRIHVGDEITESTLRFDDELGLVADVAIESWLQALPESTRRARVRILESGTGSVSEVDVELVERTDDGVTWRFAPGAVPGEYTVRLDRDGLCVEQAYRFPPMRIVRHPDASAIELVHRPFNDAELLMHNVDVPLPPLRRIAEMTVQMTWRDIETDAFHLEDSRQRVQAIETADGLTTATLVLQMARGGYDVTTRPARLDDPVLAPYLGESDFIEPFDHDIVRTARQIVGAETDARVAAEAICDWVARTVETKMIAETLPGSEVLRRGVGKCSEFATLYASLARAAGIPTRIALGQRLFDSGAGGPGGAQWGGHMWNEVWLGEWVPVDASHGEFGGSPALLKFVHSDGVVGTLDVRWRLTESLAVSVLDVKTIPVHRSVDRDQGAPLVDGLVTDGRGGVWTNVERGVRFRLPAAGWRVETVDAPGALLIRIRPPAEDDPGDSAMIHFSAFDLPPGVPMAAINRARMSQHRSQLEGIEIIEERDITIDGAVGHRCEFRGIHKDAPPVMATELLWSKDGTGCLLNLICAEPHHDSWKIHLAAIVDSFEFVGD